MKYVVLEHLLLPNRGIRFWSLNIDDNTHLADGTLAYKEVMFTNESNTAILASREININVLPNTDELIEYYTKQAENEKKDLLKRPF